MRGWIFFLLLSLSAWARPSSFSDGHCRIVFPSAYRSQNNRVVAQAGGDRYSLTKTPLKTLDPAQQLANVRRAELAQGSTVQLVRLHGLDGLEIRRARSLARMFVCEQVTYRAEVTFAGQQPAYATVFVRSLGFLKHTSTTYVPQRMARYDALVRDVPVQKCAENLLEISSLLTGFKLKQKRYPSALASLQAPVTGAYGYRRDGNHYLLYCSGHHHAGLPPHYPRTDDALRTLLGPSKIYRPGY